MIHAKIFFLSLLFIHLFALIFLLNRKKRVFDSKRNNREDVYTLSETSSAFRAVILIQLSTEIQETRGLRTAHRCFRVWVLECEELLQATSPLTGGSLVTVSGSNLPVLVETVLFHVLFYFK